MRFFRKFLSLILVVAVLMTCAFSSYAAESDTATDKSKAYKSVMNSLEYIVEIAVKTISCVFPVPKTWIKSTDYQPEKILDGTDEFLNEPDVDAKFSLGYDSESILDGFDVIGNVYVAGGISFEKKIAKEIADDLKVRTVAINDGSGRGTEVFLVLDAYGISSLTADEIKHRLYDFAQMNNINCVTVSVLHQHSSVDTFGMNGDIFEMALINPFKVAFDKKANNGKNERYMEYLYSKCIDSVKTAVRNMKPGRLFYGATAQTEFLYDKRAPFVCDENFNRFRFVPDDNSKETWLVSTEIHCVGNGVQGTTITADYPYYAEKEINEQAGANVMFYMGAQQSTSLNRNENTVENYNDDMTRLESLALFGKSIGKKLTEIEDEKEVEPLINITYSSCYIPIDNPVLLLGGKVGMFEDRIVKTGLNKYSVVTKVGYMELGKDFAFAIIPGEIAPEIVYGGCLQGDDSWTGKDWNYPSMQNLITFAGKNRKLMVLDLANDQIGYIIPDNNYMPMIAEESDSLEFVSLGKNTASTIYKAFENTIR